MIMISHYFTDLSIIVLLFLPNAKSKNCFFSFHLLFSDVMRPVQAVKQA